MAIALTSRDIQILYTLHTARYLTTPQIQALFWRTSRGGMWGRQKACERRLRQLTAAGLVRRIEQPVKRAEASKPYVYALDRAGAEVLANELDLDPDDIDWRPRHAESNYPFLDHLLATTDVRIALTLACERNGVELVEWVDEKELKVEGMKDYVTIVSPAGRKERAAIVPDALFVIRREAKFARFFLEVDLRTVTVEPSSWARRGWARKVRTYLEYFKSEEYRKRFGSRLVVILTVTTGETRLAHLKETTEKEGGTDRFWFASIDDVLEPACALTDRIWHVAGSKDRAAILA